jgi:hypothetical protein
MFAMNENGNVTILGLPMLRRSIPTPGMVVVTTLLGIGIFALWLLTR